MAVGFTPKHIEDFPLNDLTNKHFLTLAIETAEKLGWSVGYASETGIIAYTDNGMFSWNAEIKIKIEDGSANLMSSSTGNDMMDWGKNKKNINNFISTFEEVKLAMTDEELDLKYDGLKEHLVSQEEDILKLPPSTTTEQIKDFFSVFIPTKAFFVTPILIDINIIVFIVMAIGGVDIMSPSGESLINWGANFKPMTLDGQWWRLITNCFLHIGIFHLLMNMYALLYIGVLLEPILGKLRFISAYLLTGITASLASLWWHDITISAGASGAIFGMYGIFLALLTTDLIEKNARKALMASIALFVGFNLLNGLKGGIDNAAHIGGLLGGVMIGYAFIPSLKQYENTKWKYSTITILTLFVSALSIFVCKKMPNDIGTYDKKMEIFSTNEAMALDVYNKPQETPKEELLKEIRERGTYYWNENKKIIEDADKLKLPDKIHKRNAKLKMYCDLRLKSYELMYKRISEDEEPFDQEMETYNKQINDIVTELGGGKQ